MSEDSEASTASEAAPVCEVTKLSDSESHVSPVPGGRHWDSCPHPDTSHSAPIRRLHQGKHCPYATETHIRPGTSRHWVSSKHPDATETHVRPGCARQWVHRNPPGNTFWIPSHVKALVTNLHHGKCNVYVGRPDANPNGTGRTPTTGHPSWGWGNPFPISNTASRESVIRQYTSLDHGP